MTVTLYTLTAHYTQSSEGFGAVQATPSAEVPSQAAVLLGCTLGLVDVLANGPGFVVYTIFDSEEAANPEATQAVAALTGINFDSTNNLTWQVVNAADYGVPQIRKRLIVVGVREGVFEFPEPTHGTAVGQPHLSSGEVLATVISATTNTAKVTYARNPDTRPNPYHGQLYNGGGRPIDLAQPAPTILASAGGNKAHFLDLHGLVPTYHAHLGRGGAPQTGELPGARRLTIEESAALQTFPADMVFLGPQSSQYRQIGNAVPPGLARVIGDALVEHLAAHQQKKPLPQQQLQLFADTSSSNVAKSRSKEENPVYRAVTKVLESIDFFLRGGQLDGHALPPAPLRAAASNLVSQSKYSTSCIVPR